MKKAQLLSDSGDLSESITALEDTISTTRYLVAKDPGNAKLTVNLAFRLVLMAQTMQKANNLSRAVVAA